jgi:hypothetical protein
MSVISLLDPTTKGMLPGEACCTEIMTMSAVPVDAENTTAYPLDTLEKRQSCPSLCTPSEDSNKYEICRM